MSVIDPLKTIDTPVARALAACRKHFGYAILFSALVNILFLAPTIYMLQIYDRVVATGSTMTLIFITIALLLALVTLGLLDMARSRLLTLAGARLDRMLSVDILRASQGANAGQSRQALRDFDSFRQAASGPAMLAVFDLPWTPIYIFVCFWLHPWIGALALASGLILAALAIMNERATRSAIEQAGKAGMVAYAVQDTASSQSEAARALGVEDALTTQFEHARMTAAVPQARAAFTGNKFASATKFLRQLVQSLALGLGAYLAINNEVSLGAIIAASVLVARGLAPIEQIVGNWRTLATAKQAYGELNALLGKGRTDEVRTRLPAPKAELQAVRLGVVADDRARLIISDVTFAGHAGEVIAVVAPSGAGKTTLMRLLANARDPDQGEVRIDSARYRDWEPRRLARHVGYLPQDVSLFQGTVRDNISRFDAVLGMDAGEVDFRTVEAAKVAGVHDMILRLPKGYDTMLGPRGAGLSAGQSQRVALARAVYGDPVLLVLDEPNAHLDAEGETILVQVMQSVKARGGLVIVAAHRQGVVAAADKLLVLRDGRVDKWGPRDQVLAELRGGAEPRPVQAVTAFRPKG